MSNIIGKTFGHWLVLGYAERRGTGQCVKCKCQCGAEKSVYVGDLLSGGSKSWGCRGPLEERFWAKVDKSGGSDGCWVWVGGLDSKRYGHIGIKGKTISAHRLSYELYREPIPKGMCVCHHCDTPSCVNPEHLFVGAQSDNIQDMIAKGRHGNTKLTSDKVREIRERVANGEKQVSLIKEFGVSQTTISEIITRKTYQRIT